MSRPPADPPLRLDRSSAVPLTVQLSDALRGAMSEGLLRPGERLPSSRSLAAQLGVSRTVVTEAFQQLYAEGWLDGRHGSGTYVAEHASPSAPPSPGAPAPPGGRPPPAAGRAPEPRLSRAEARRLGMVDLRPGVPWVRSHDGAAWRRAWRHAASLPLDDDPDPRGLPRLREALAEHLRRTRGVRVGPRNVLVTRGTGNGLDLLAATVLARGGRAGVEEPGYQRARDILESRGAEVVPCRVDRDGIVVDDLPADLSVVYTTPAHQYPLGGRLPVPRRERLLAWARSRGALVVEDDYDAEFRYDVAPLPALYGLDPGHVVLLGTLSKTLSPDLGIGWLVADAALLERVAGTRDRLSDRTGVQAQAATALLLERGDLDRHLRRMRLEYARRRRTLIDHLGPYLTGDTAGLHVMLPLPADAVAGVVAESAEQGVLVEDTSRASHGEPTVHGLILGYGAAHPADLRRACRVLAGAVGRRAGGGGPAAR
ncbi:MULTISPECIES: MocR-like pyridoxine biosynthesis transcription factor PdxR [Nocardiopsidaceae]|uniref:PLP-dependent aminotransferase family protein n=1 Tax=Streptomonospora nanhaiensis TaxID=1323731 RepID=A0ABY6YUB7_9ACTN|nr:PLP-dependent aminotransferase family protein [Streptomonospora nanhaiensis]WAE75946.1 PLP-dependent aminotransferase family protein [Streptomonospora nanhaiensis]